MIIALILLVGLPLVGLLYAYIITRRYEEDYAKIQNTLRVRRGRSRG